MDESIHSSDNDPLRHERMGGMRCRVDQRLWWFVPLGAIQAIFGAVAPWLPDNKGQQAPILLAWPMALVFGWVTAWMVFELVRGEIRADESGLSWRRGFAGWQHARWEEISDFYLKKHTRSHIVETPSGKLELSKGCEGIEKIVELVPQRAVNAAASSWEQQGFRRGKDWSLSLGYWTNPQKWTVPLMSAGALYLVGVFGWIAVFGGRQGGPGPSIFWFEIFPVVLLVALFGTLGVMMVWMLFSLWRERRFAWEHRDEMLHLDAQGLVFSSTNGRVEAGWDEVRAIAQIKPQNGLRCVEVSTEGGNFVVWRLSNSMVWSQFGLIARDYVPQAFEALRNEGAQEAMEEDLNGTRGAWSGNKEGEGARVFSFRSRNNRLALLCASVAFAFVPVFYLVMHYQTATDENPFAPLWPLLGAICGVAAVVIGVMWVWFGRATIWADDEGLQLRFPLLKPRRVLWKDMKEAGRDALGEWVRVGEKKIYFAFFIAPVRRAELLQLIEGGQRKTRSRSQL